MEKKLFLSHVLSLCLAGRYLTQPHHLPFCPPGAPGECEVCHWGNGGDRLQRPGCHDRGPEGHLLRRRRLHHHLRLRLAQQTACSHLWHQRQLLFLRRGCANTHTNTQNNKKLENGWISFKVRSFAGWRTQAGLTLRRLRRCCDRTNDWPHWYSRWVHPRRDMCNHSLSPSQKGKAQIGDQLGLGMMPGNISIYFLFNLYIYVFESETWLERIKVLIKVCFSFPFFLNHPLEKWADCNLLSFWHDSVNCFKWCLNISGGRKAFLWLFFSGHWCCIECLCQQDTPVMLCLPVQLCGLPVCLW